jgi:hypothetical protein
MLCSHKSPRLGSVRSHFNTVARQLPAAIWCIRRNIIGSLVPFTGLIAFFAAWLYPYHRQRDRQHRMQFSDRNPIDAMFRPNE